MAIFKSLFVTLMFTIFYMHDLYTSIYICIIANNDPHFSHYQNTMKTPLHPYNAS